MRLPLLLCFLFLATAKGFPQTSQVELISKSPAVLDFGGNADSGAPGLSADGRFVLFSSGAENLVPEITKQPVADIYLHDRQSSFTRWISLSTNGTTGADNHCWNPQISADGSKVMFETAAGNLIHTLTNGTAGVVVYDLEADSMVHASVGLNGTNASAPARNALLSADGGTVVFESAAINLTTGIVYRTPETPHIFARHLESNKTELIDMNYRNQEPARSGIASFSSIVGISSNGSRVAFLSNGTNFIQVFPQSIRSNNLWVRDLILRTNILVSSFSNQPSFFDIRSPSMSADGTKFLYSNGRTNFFRDIAEPNAVTTQIPTNVVALTISPDGELASYFKWISWGGGTSGPNNSGPRIFVGRVMDSQFVEVPVSSSNGDFVFSSDSGTIAVSTFEGVFDEIVTVGDREIRIRSAKTAIAPTASAHGNVVATESWSSTNAFLNVFVEENGTTTLISKGLGVNSAPFEPTQGPEDISTDGNFVLYTSFAALVPGDQNESQDVYLWDRAAKTNHLVSRALNGGSGNAASFMPSMTPAGEHVVFVSAATNLVNSDTNRSYDVFIWTRTNETVRLVSPRADGLSPTAAPFPTTLACSWPVVSKDGRYVAFASKRPDLISGLPAQAIDRVYLRDLEINTTVRAFPTNIAGLSWPRTIAVHDGPVVYYMDRTNLFSFDVATGSAKGFSNCVNSPSFSRDGGRMALISRIGAITSLFVWEIATGERREVYRYPDGATHGLESSVSLSSDGKRVAFVTSQALVPQDRNATNDVYVTDVDEPRQFRLVQADLARAALSVKSAYPSISEDGRQVGFVSKPYEWPQRSNAVVPQVYLVDLALRRSVAIQPERAQNPYFPSGHSAPLMSQSGWLVFGTIDPLTVADANRSVDPYFWELPSSLADIDKDELPDEWEMAAFGNLTHGPADDSDGDGQSNRLEYLAGTEPNSTDSVLRLEIAQATAGEIKLRWRVVPEKNYEVLYNTSLTEDWTILADAYAVVNGGAELSVEPAVEALFFRVQLKE